MANSASTSSLGATRHRVRRAHVAALCCGLLLSGPVVMGAATPAVAAAQERTQHERPGRGTLVSADKLYTLASPQAAAAELRTAGFADETVRYGVVAYRLICRTVDAHGQPTTASGLFALPLDAGRHLRRSPSRTAPAPTSTTPCPCGAVCSTRRR